MACGRRLWGIGLGDDADGYPRSVLTAFARRRGIELDASNLVAMPMDILGAFLPILRDAEASNLMRLRGPLPGDSG